MVIRDCLKAGHPVFQLVNRYTLQGIGYDFIVLQYTVIYVSWNEQKILYIIRCIFFLKFLFIGREVTT